MSSRNRNLNSTLIPLPSGYGDDLEEKSDPNKAGPGAAATSAKKPKKKMRK
jgi:hypothetical protein